MFDPLTVSGLIIESYVPDPAISLPFCALDNAVELISTSYKCSTFNGPTGVITPFLSVGVAVHGSHIGS
jgi:hypothetical protein